jgi:type II secretory pathway pseudopilin PulG
VGVNTEEGYVSVGNGNQHPAKLFLAGAIVPVSALASIAIPNFVKARQTAQKNACINNLRQIDGAAQQWALENKKSETTIPTRKELLPYLRNHQFPICPAGGQYTLNQVSAAPECTQPGHNLPK